MINIESLLSQAQVDRLVSFAINKDKERFETSKEWLGGKDELPFFVDPRHREIWGPEKQLLLFWLCSVIDTQKNPAEIWSKGRESMEILAEKWINSENAITKSDIEKYSYTRHSLYIPKHLEKTLRTLSRFNKNISHFIISAITESQKTMPIERRIYFVFENLCNELFRFQPEKVSTEDSIGTYKRVWMFLMFIRRDKKLVKDLMECAFKSSGVERNITDIWYSEEFPEIQCELPVDSRVKGFFKKIGINCSEMLIGRWAHDEIGQKRKLPPSIMDVLFTLKNQEQEDLAIEILKI